MTKVRPLLITGALLALSAFSAAQADPAAGTYQLKIGHAASCPVTLAADGSATISGDCTHDAQVARWQARYNGIELDTASGETVAVLKSSDGAYAGKTFADGRPVTLTSDSTVAASH